MSADPLIKGFYIGTFESTCGNGNFGLTAATGSSEGVFLAISTDGATRKVANLFVNRDNKLEIKAFLNSKTTITGRITKTGFRGTIKGGNCSGKISGPSVGNSFETAAIAGYYSKEIEIRLYEFRCTGYFLGACIREGWALKETFTGFMNLLAAENGSGYVLFQSKHKKVSSDGGQVTFFFDNSLLSGQSQNYHTDCIGPQTACWLQYGQVYGWFSYFQFDAAYPTSSSLRYRVNLAEDLFANGQADMVRDRKLPHPLANGLPWISILIR